MLKAILTPIVPIFAAAAAWFFQQVWWVRGFEGSVVGFAAFILIPAAINYATNLSNAVTYELTATWTSCPCDGRVSTVELRYSSVVPQQAVRSP